MSALDSVPTRTSRTTSRVGVVVAAVATAVTGNLVVYAVGRFSGGDFTFTQGSSTAEVDAITVAGFSAVPLTVGLIVVALLAPRVPAIARVALVVAPLLAVVTIGVMTIPADLDRVSALTLAVCHLTLVPISITAIRRLRP